MSTTASKGIGYETRHGFREVAEYEATWSHAKNESRKGTGFEAVHP